VTIGSSRRGATQTESPFDSVRRSKLGGANAGGGPTVGVATAASVSRACWVGSNGEGAVRATSGSAGRSAGGPGTTSIRMKASVR